MCMYGTHSKPLVAKKDIVCVKYLRKEGRKYLTPAQDTPVKLGKVLEPTTQLKKVEKTGRLYEFNGGVIHACSYKTDWWSDAKAFKAIIPAGTEYWVGNHTNCIVARQLLITKEEADTNEPDVNMLNDILENRPTCGDKAVGDYKMKDGSFVTPFNINDKNRSDIIGVIVGFKGEKPLIWSGEFTEPMAIDTQYDSKFDEFTSSPSEDFDGEKHTDAFFKKFGKKFDGKRYQIYAALKKYKPEVGKWYLPAGGELVTMAENLMYIQAASYIANTTLRFSDNTDWLWSSSERSLGDCWGVCVGDDGGFGTGWRYRCGLRRACFFLASPSADEESK